MAAPKKVDYARIEPDWRAGIKSPKQLASEYEADTGTKVSHTAIIKHFTKLGVPRDLSQKIKDKAEAMVSQSMVAGKVSAETLAKDTEIIEANATAIATIQLDHRKDIKRHRLLAMKLLQEIEAETDDSELFEKLGELMLSPDASGKDRLNELYHKVISTPSRIDSMKKLSETLKNLISLERQALGLDDDRKPTDDPVAEFLKKCSGRALPLAGDDE